MSAGQRALAVSGAGVALVLAIALGSGATTTRAQAPGGSAREPVFTAPPGEESPALRALIDRAQAALEAGRTVTDLLTDEAFMPARAWPRFRALIRAHAPVGEATLVPASEPGEPLVVRGVVRDAAGRPLGGALLYLYHTSAKGWYAAEAPHIGGGSGDMRHARLFVYLRTDAEGHYEFRTVRPQGYPATDLPAHIHVHVDSSDGALSRATEIRFDDDPRLTEAWRERSREEGVPVYPVKRAMDGVSVVEADFELR